MTNAEKRKRIVYLRSRASQLCETFDVIKDDPMDLNRLMSHLGLVTLSVDEILNEIANMMEESLNE